MKKVIQEFIKNRQEIEVKFFLLFYRLIINIEDEEDNINDIKTLNQELIWKIDELDLNILWQMKKNWIEKECGIFIKFINILFYVKII